MTLLLEVQDRLKPEEFEFFKPKVETKDKRTLMMIKCYKTTKDQDDFVNSLQRAFGKAQKWNWYTFQLIIENQIKSNFT